MANRGLQLLHRVYHEMDQTVECSPMIARVLSNLALDSDLHRHIIDGGMIYFSCL